LQGRNIYIREGCYACHSQMIRTLRDEVERYGPYSLAVESKYDHPMLWGSKRTGPDLARMGNKYSDEWHVRHLNNPREVVPQSVMPHYSWLGRTELRSDDLGAHLAALRKVGVPYTDDMIANARSDAYGQAAPDTPYAEGVTKRMAKRPTCGLRRQDRANSPNSMPGRLSADSRQADRRRAQAVPRREVDHGQRLCRLVLEVVRTVLSDRALDRRARLCVWPSNKKRSTTAAQSILEPEDKPHRDQPWR
jgi:hypothetical protein